MLLLLPAWAASPMQKTLAPLVEPAIEADALQGLALGLFSGGTLEVVAYGDAKTTDIFELGSVSKGFTGLLLAETLRRDEVRLDDLAAVHLPFSLPTHKGHAIRVEHLATHTSGLPRMPRDFAPSDPGDPYRGVDAAALAAFLETTRLDGEPGTHYAYSNLGAAVLGRVLSEAAGKPYATLLEERLFQPLGMKRCTVDASKLAQGHTADGEPAAAWTLGAFAPAGAVECPAGDVLRLVEAAMDATGPLSPAFALATQQHESLGTEGGIGLGWHISAAGVVWHNGQTGGFHSLVAFHPERGIGVVALGNTATPLVEQIGFGALEVLAGQQVKPPVVRRPVAVSDKALEALAGQWGPAAVIVDSGKLFLQLAGQSKVRLWPESETSFFLRVAPATARFDGEQLIFEQQGVPKQAWPRSR